MMDEKLVAKLIVERSKKEIQRAIRQVKQPKRTELDKWFRREWHRAAPKSEVWPFRRR